MKCKMQSCSSCVENKKKKRWNVTPIVLHAIVYVAISALEIVTSYVPLTKDNIVSVVCFFCARPFNLYLLRIVIRETRAMLSEITIDLRERPTPAQYDLYINVFIAAAEMVNLI